MTTSPAKLGEVMRNVPNALFYTVGACFIAIIAAFVVLAWNGSSTADLRAFLNTILNIASVLLGGGSLVFAGAAAKSAGRAEQQTNGALDDRIAEGVSRALTRHAAAKGDPGPARRVK